jgi:ribosomal protein S18 acetylase RimI-like enzyme
MTASDLEAVGVLAGRLVRLHHGFDEKRYLRLDNPEQGYARYFRSELGNEEALLLVAEEDGKIVAYAYARMQGKSYDELLDTCGKLHDIYVDESARSRGIGEALLGEVCARLAAKGAPRVLLLTAVQNEAAQRLFQRVGFRTTMLEMTREL